MLHAGPFVTTYFGIVDNGVVAEENVPAVPIPYSRTTDLSLIGVTSDGGPRHQAHRLVARHRGLQGRRTSALFGVNGESLIYAGGQINSGGFLAPIVRIARIESTGTQISARAQMGWLDGTSLQVPRLLVLARTAIAGAANNTSDPSAAAREIGAWIVNGGFPRVILAGADTFGLNASSIEAAAVALGEDVLGCRPR